MNIKNINKYFYIGGKYHNKYIQKEFNVDGQNGIRPSVKNNWIVLIDKSENNEYGDTFNGSELQYIGMGKKGKQHITSGRNKTLKYSVRDHKPVYLFFEYNKIYIFAGQVKLSRKPYQISHGVNTYVFPLISNDDSNVIKEVYNDILNEQVDSKDFKDTRSSYNNKHNESKNNDNKSIKDQIHKNLDDLKGLDRSNSLDLGNHKHTSKTTHYKRNKHIKNLAVLFSKGICQKCHKPGPFIDENTGLPYVESHHINWLSRRGHDSLKNVIALCPNCHREMHYSKKYDLKRNPKNINCKEIKQLKKRALHYANYAKRYLINK